MCSMLLQDKLKKTPTESIKLKRFVMSVLFFVYVYMFLFVVEPLRNVLRRLKTFCNSLDVR